MKTTRKRKAPAKKTGILISLAESIGSTLGSIAAKTNAAQKTLRRRTIRSKRRQRKT
jgi:hypothetical protein